MKKPAAARPSKTAQVAQAIEKIGQGSVNDIRAAVEGEPLTYVQVSGVLQKLALRIEPVVHHLWTGQWAWTGVTYRKRPEYRKIETRETLAVLNVIANHAGIQKSRIMNKTGLSRIVVEQITRKKNTEGIIEFRTNGWVLVEEYNEHGNKKREYNKEHDKHTITADDIEWMRKWSPENREYRKRERIIESLNY